MGFTNLVKMSEKNVASKLNLATLLILEAENPEERKHINSYEYNYVTVNNS